ncbi:MAG TPA: serine/threonine-protein kinase [Solirubrobacteraceae bacterium]|nr:serine/threonine-protein kinase [Solirubrobacteraceae bacterium]
MSSSRTPTERERTAPTVARTAATAAQPAPGPGPSLSGSILDRYTLGRRVGSGAFGSVWMARDEHLQRDVAVKILARELVSDGRFEREARAAARLQHPGIVTLYEAAVDADGAYLVSELVDGATLDRLLADGALSDRDILRIGLALCDALDHAHSQGVVHRDVKPSNVLVPSGGRDGRPPARGQTAKLTDFGVARVIDAESLTLSGDVIGTLNYMAPEQAAGLEASEPADLYSLAVVLYEALTGINPLRSGGAVPGSRRMQPTVLPPLRRQRRDLPVSLGDAIDRALRPQQHDRGTIADLRFDLERALPQVGDEPGIVTDWTLRRPSADGETEPLFWPRLPKTAAHETQPAAERREPRPDPRNEPRRTRPRRAPVPLADPDPDRLFWQQRALAALCAAGAAAWIGGRVLDPSPLPLALLALVAGGATLLLPRLGWLGTVCFACATAAIQGHDGTALVIALAAVVPIVAMPVTPTAWPLAAAAPALGLVGSSGLAGAWPALAGLSRTPWRRAALAVSGWIWLLAAGVLARPPKRAGHVLYVPGPHRLPAHRAWSDSLSVTVHHLLPPYLHSGVLLGAAAWALAALLVPWVIRGVSIVADVVRVALWSTATVAAMAIAVTVVRGPATAALHGSHRAPTTSAEVLGAVVGGMILLVWSVVRSRLPSAAFAGSTDRAP